MCYTSTAQYLWAKCSRISQHSLNAQSNQSIYNNLMNGVIKKLTDRGFGFITVEGQEKDLFFHGKSLVGVQFDELHEGDAVTFDTEDSPKGMNAVNVKRA